ncbi:hypothetical protein HPB50_021012 [Hyalomma asiaticum]|uniref:Uncharacterized protein n=1 Tax=Hyalomma asiaticum TaxID=266040 RepID=A0ACB7SQ45_HYAAI|nr:hypothetical protein HPB50_021012 [Hyalomma asiaticum]
MAFKSSTCATDFCKQYSALLESSVDDGVDACQDFYQHVCGLWDKTHTSDKSVMGQAWNDYIDFVMSKLSDAKLRPGNADVEDKARLYLKACLKVTNESNVPNVKRILAKGGIVWPEKNPKPDFLKALLFMSRYVFMPVLLHLSYDTGRDGRNGLLIWKARKDYRERARILLTLGKTKHIRDHLRISYEQFNGTLNDTRLDEIMDHMGVFLSLEANFAYADLTPITFNDSTKFLEYAPSVPKQRWLAALGQYTVGPIESYSGVTIEGVDYFKAVFDMHKKNGEDVMNDIVESLCVQMLMPYTSMDMILSFHRGQGEMSAIALRKSCFHFFHSIFGFAVNYHLLHDLVNVERHTRELAQNLQSTFIEYAGKWPRNANLPGRNASAPKGDLMWESVFQYLDRSVPSRYPSSYKGYPNMTGDPLENWLRTQSYYMTLTGSQEDYFITYESRDYVSFSNFRMMLHYLMFPFAAGDAHIGVLTGGLGLRLAATVFHQLLKEAGDDEASKIKRQNQLCLGLDSNEVDEDLQGAIAAVPVVQKLYSRVRTDDQYKQFGGDIPSFTEEQVPFVAGCYLLCGESRGPTLCNTPVMHSAEFSRAFHCSGHAPMNPSKKCPMWPAR